MERTHKIRTEFEQSILPHVFSQKRAMLLSALMQHRGRFLLDYYKQAALRHSDYRCPYEAEDFSVSFHEFKKETHSVLVVCVGMPVPDKPHECRAAYLCFGNEHCGDLYVISELNDAGTQTLRAMTADGGHTDLSGSTPDELDMVLDYYWEMNHTNGKS